MEANSVDSLVTDPPAGISFMGKDWDGDKGGRDAWVTWMQSVMAECLRVLKPGAHGLVWAIPRTSHWTMTALEKAGFEVRDVVTHLFGTGFPKSLDVSKAIDKAAGAKREPLPDPQAKRRNSVAREFWSSSDPSNSPVTAPATDDAKRWQGWGTALKPACEFWILVRKPCSEKTVAANVLKWGTGALNIDGCRIASDIPNPSIARRASTPRQGQILGDWKVGGDGKAYSAPHPGENLGRFPANLVLDEEAAKALDEQSGTLKSGNLEPHHKLKASDNLSMSGGNQERSPRRSFGGDSGGASRFFYVAKASRADKGADNTHPTVKSTALMSYLIRLVTPPNGTVLDPFMGSGSTGVAAKREGFGFVGIERERAYVDTAIQRMEAM